MKKKDSYGKEGMAKKSSVISPGTGGGSRPGGGKMKTPTSNPTSDLEKTRKGGVKSLT